MSSASACNRGTANGFTLNRIEQFDCEPISLINDLVVHNDRPRMSALR